jgi:hypothetical protein
LARSTNPTFEFLDHQIRNRPLRIRESREAMRKSSLPGIFLLFRIHNSRYPIRLDAIHAWILDTIHTWLERRIETGRAILATKTIRTILSAGGDVQSRPGLSSIESLQADSDHPEVQEMIRRMIYEGTVRVRPMPGCPGRVAIEPA